MPRVSNVVDTCSTIRKSSDNAELAEAPAKPSNSVKPSKSSDSANPAILQANKEIKKLNDKLKIISDLEDKVARGKKLFVHEQSLILKRPQFEAEIAYHEAEITREAIATAQAQAAASGDDKIFIPTNIVTPPVVQKQSITSKPPRPDVSTIASDSSIYWSQMHSKYHILEQSGHVTIPSGSIVDAFCNHNIASKWRVCWDYLTNPTGCKNGEFCAWEHPYCVGDE